jgi:uncharacterized protein DUF2848
MKLRVAGTGELVELTPEKLVVAGYTGRDEAAVAEHIAELAAIGVPAPERVPAFYDLDPALVTSAEEVPVSGPMTSGEVEPVLIRHGGRFFLGVGSDHTDRDLERADIGLSKAACPKPLGGTVAAIGPEDWPRVWDDITLESTVDERGYQRGSAGTLREPGDLLARLTEAVGEIAGDFVLYCGTVPVLGGEFFAGESWRIRLEVPGGPSLTHGYRTVKRSA